MRVVRVVVIAVAMVSLAAGSARAATTLGQQPPEANPTNCAPGSALLNTGVASGAGYAAPAAGVITSWSTKAGDAVGVSAKLKVFRATADPDSFLVVGQSAFRAITPSAVNGPFVARIAVLPGDIISAYPGPNGGPCQFATPAGDDASLDRFRVPQSGPDAATGSAMAFFAPSTGARANVTAVLEPDADGDGFGDESQDRCLGAAGALDGCPPDSNPPTATEPSTAVGPVKRLIKARGRRARVPVSFSSPDSSASFVCSVDGAAFAACSSPAVFEFRAKRKAIVHEVVVAAVDAAGHQDATPAVVAFEVKRKPRRHHD